MNYNFYARQIIDVNLIQLLPAIKALFLSNGQQVAEFETAFKEFIGVNYCLSFFSMRQALQQAAMFYRKKYPSKTEVLIPEYTHYSDLVAILWAGCYPRYVPVKLEDYTIDEKKIKKYITHKTLAILVTHIHGCSCNMTAIKKIAQKYKLVIFEDCAHAIGTKSAKKSAGSWGIGCFSFGLGKTITAFGGGCLTTDDPQLYQFLRQKRKLKTGFLFNLKLYFKGLIYWLLTHKVIGFWTLRVLLILLNKIGGASYLSEKADLTATSRFSDTIESMSDFQANLARLQLQNTSRLARNILKRKEIGKTYEQILDQRHFKKGDVCFQYPLWVKNKKDFKVRMLQLGFDVQDDYCSYLPGLFPVKGYPIDPNMAKIFQQIVYLPTAPMIPINKARATASYLKKSTDMMK